MRLLIILLFVGCGTEQIRPIEGMTYLPAFGMHISDHWPSDCEPDEGTDYCFETWEMNKFGCLRTKQQLEEGITCEELNDE